MTYHAAQPPRPRHDLVYHVPLTPILRLKVLNNTGVQLVVFGLALLSVLVLDQQPFGIEAVLDGIPRNSFLTGCCCWSGRLSCVPTVRRDFSGRDGSFS